MRRLRDSPATGSRIERGLNAARRVGDLERRLVTSADYTFAEFIATRPARPVRRFVNYRRASRRWIEEGKRKGEAVAADHSTRGCRLERKVPAGRAIRALARDLPSQFSRRVIDYLRI